MTRAANLQRTLSKLPEGVSGGHPGQAGDDLHVHAENAGRASPFRLFLAGQRTLVNTTS